MDLILVAVISLGAIGLIAAVILYAASKKFAVYEDPRIAQVSEVLPQASREWRQRKTDRVRQSQETFMR